LGDRKISHRDGTSIVGPQSLRDVFDDVSTEVHPNYLYYVLYYSDKTSPPTYWITMTVESDETSKTPGVTNERVERSLQLHRSGTTSTGPPVVRIESVTSMLCLSL
jgi:hypothetical protein